MIFFIIPFNLKTRVAWSRDLTWFDTNINLISIHIDSCFCFKFTRTLLSDTYFRWHYFCFVTLPAMLSRLTFDTETFLKLRDQNFRFQNLCILLKFFKKLSSPLQTWILEISGTFPICFGCFLLTNTTENTCWMTEVLQSHILAILLVSRQQACDRDLWEQDETWNLQDRDWEKWSQDFITANNPMKSSNQNSC